MGPLQNDDSYIGQLLVKDGVINREDLDRGLVEQAKRREFLCRSLVRLGFASEEKIFTVLSFQIGISYVNLSEVSVDPAVLSRIPGKFAQACGFFPIRIEGQTLFLAMTDPLNAEACQEIKAYVGLENLKVFLTGEDALKATTKKYYGL